ncbi:MAG: hypothetical protein O3C40_11135 [Planctomycetota bacterium]|nr:hypothetical protein [Planctomycetota bacterium]
MSRSIIDKFGNSKANGLAWRVTGVVGNGRRWYNVENGFLRPQTWMSESHAPQTHFLLKSPENWPTSLENSENTFRRTGVPKMGHSVYPDLRPGNAGWAGTGVRVHAAVGPANTPVSASVMLDGGRYQCCEKNESEDGDRRTHWLEDEDGLRPELGGRRDDVTASADAADPCPQVPGFRR